MEEERTQAYFSIMEKVLCDSSFIVNFPTVIHCHILKYRGKMYSVSFILIGEFQVFLFLFEYGIDCTVGLMMRL